jgi:hypothetical protein
MKITELRYNPAKQKKGGWYKDVPKGTPGATEKWVKDPATGKWLASQTDFHLYVTDEPHVDKDGNPVLSKQFNEPHFRPRTVNSWNTKTNKPNPRHGQLSRAGRNGEGHILGTVGDWLTLMGADRHDISAARLEVLHSPEYQELTGRLDFQDISSRGDINNGTITLQGSMEGLIGTEEGTKAFRRKILANGQIRAYSSYGESVHTHHGWRPATFHPLTIENSPDLTPHERIVQTMRQSLAQLVRHYKSSAVRHFKSTMKKEED